MILYVHAKTGFVATTSHKHYTDLGKLRHKNGDFKLPNIVRIELNQQQKWSFCNVTRDRVYLIDTKCIDTLSILVQNFHRFCIGSIQSINLEQKEIIKVWCCSCCDTCSRCSHWACSRVLGVLNDFAVVTDVVVVGVMFNGCCVHYHMSVAFEHS